MTSLLAASDVNVAQNVGFWIIAVFMVFAASELPRELVFAQLDPRQGLSAQG